METKNKEKFTAWAKGLTRPLPSSVIEGLHTKYLVYNAIALEDFGKPVVLLANNGFG